MTDHTPDPAEIRAFAALHGLTNEQARQLLAEHRAESGLEEALRNLKHFLRAPS